MSIYDYKVKKRDWDLFSLSELKWKVVIIVNTATWCWFTPQYEWLENLYKKYHEQWLEILDFPCNQFWHQASWDDNEIHQFCALKYNTTFDQFSKIDVNWDDEIPLYTYLKKEQPVEKPVWIKNKLAMIWVKKMSTTCKKKWDIVWNFTKFLVNKEWVPVKRYDPTYKPENMEDDLLSLLS